MPGRTNMVADALSRWAHPASQAARDVTKHGTVEDKEEMLKLIEEEEEEVRKCRVTTRSGKETKEQEDEEQEQEGEVSKVQPTPTQTCEKATTPGSGPRPSFLTED